MSGSREVSGLSGGVRDHRQESTGGGGSVPQTLLAAVTTVITITPTTLARRWEWCDVVHLLPVQMSSSHLSLPPLFSFSGFSSVPAKPQHNVLVSVVVVQLVSSESGQILKKYERCQLFVIYWDILFLHPFLPPPVVPPPLPPFFLAPIAIFLKTLSLSLLLHWDDLLHSLLSPPFRVILHSAVYPSASSVPPSFPDRHNRVDIFSLSLSFFGGLFLRHQSWLYGGGWGVGGLWEGSVPPRCWPRPWWPYKVRVKCMASQAIGFKRASRMASGASSPLIRTGPKKKKEKRASCWEVWEMKEEGDDAAKPAADFGQKVWRVSFSCLAGVCEHANTALPSEVPACNCCWGICMFPLFWNWKCGPRSEPATWLVCRWRGRPESAGGEAMKRRILHFHHSDFGHIVWSSDAAWDETLTEIKVSF